MSTRSAALSRFPSPFHFFSSIPAFRPSPFFFCCCLPAPVTATRLPWALDAPETERTLVIVGLQA